jgi:hypothetical protein
MLSLRWADVRAVRVRHASVNALKLIQQNDDFNGTAQSEVTFHARAGTTYWIAVDGYNRGLGADQGTIQMSPGRGKRRHR